MVEGSKLEVETLRLLKTYYDVQKLRVATELRVEVNQFILCPNKHLIPAKSVRDVCPKCGAKATMVVMEQPPVLTDVKDGLEKLEKMLYKELEDRVVGHPLYVTYLRHVRGVGAVMGAYLITVLNPAKFETLSKLWKYCGMHIVDGKAPRRVAGKPVDWNPVARTMMWKLGENFRKVGGFYKYMYRKFYVESLEKHKDWTKAHHINHARRVTVKLFLSHCMWYVIECPYCGLLQVVRAGQKSRTCFKCRKRILIDPKKVNIIYKSDNVKEITYVLLRLKEKRFKIK